MINSCKIAELDKPYRHWKNCDEPGKTCYVTSTCLDFAHLLQRPEMRKQMALHILEASDHHNAKLHSFTVMTHHVHFLLTPNQNQTISQFMMSFKSHTSKEMAPLLNNFEKSQLSQQIGLNHRSFWKRGFRGLPIDTEQVFWQKVNYIHQNAVRSGYVKEAEDYAWGSGHLYLAGLCDESTGLRLKESIELFRDIEL